MDRRDHSRATTAGGDGFPAALERLCEAARLLLPIQSEASLGRVIAETAATVFEASGTALFSVDDKALVLTATCGCCATLTPEMRITRNPTAVWRAALTGAPTRATGPADAPDGLQDERPALAMPLSISSEIIGVVWLRFIQGDAAPARGIVDLFTIQAAAALENARQYRMLADSDRRKDREIATLAHELRNPLGAIINALRVLERVGAPDVQAIRLRELIGRQAKHLTRLVEDVLDAARLRHGKFQLQQQPIDLRDIVRQALDSLQAAGRCADHKIGEAFVSEGVVVDGDATRLEQVVRNLLDNALKYSPPSTAIHVSVDRDGDDGVLAIRDEGIGIGSELLPRLFEPFAQAEPGGPRAGGGLGLGLPLVRAIVEEHGGSVTAHSDGPGKGSHFIVRVPLRPVAS